MITTATTTTKSSNKHVDVQLTLGNRPHQPQLRLAGSKSETNRWLLLQALHPQLQLINASTSDDSLIMQAALQQGSGTIHCGHAGTALRFLTAYFAHRPGNEVVLTGSDRLCERPIAPLVEALRSWGAHIEYVNQEGCAPLRITGKSLQPIPIQMEAQTSSQFITSLLLLSAAYDQPFELQLLGPISSEPYIRMTLALLEQWGKKCIFENQTIQVLPQAIPPLTQAVVESDWSSASYWYAWMAMSTPGEQLSLQQLYPHSLQGDAYCATLFKTVGVNTIFDANGQILLTKINQPLPSQWTVDCTPFPDVAQTLMVTALGLRIPLRLTGLHTLRIKETDRITAMQQELQTCGAQVQAGPDWLELIPPQQFPAELYIQTYHDHRMALAFAPLVLQTPLVIQDADVVRKSYPEFWNHIQQMGVVVREVSA